MTQTSTAVETRKGAALGPVSPWGSAAEGIDHSDILIPRLRLMQAQSEGVRAKTAGIGDILRSTTGEILSTDNKPCTIIPLMTYKTWVICERVGNKAEFRGEEPFTAANAHLDREWQENGVFWERNMCLNFFVLLPSDIDREKKALEKAKAGDMPDPGDALFPCLLQAQRSSYVSCGKKLINHYVAAAHFEKPPFISMFHLSSESTENAKGIFSIFTVKPAGKTSDAHQAIAKKWYDTLTIAKAKNKIVVDSEVTDG